MAITLEKLIIELGLDVAALRGDVQGAQKQLDNLEQAATRAGATLAVFGGAIVGALGVATKASIDFESAWTGVLKTVEGTPAQLNQLRQQFLDLSTIIPVAADELAAIGEIAGQLGIQRQDVLAFTRTIADLGVASDLTGQEGATMLARFAGITNIGADQYRNLANVIVDLGNNSRGTEREITEMGLRLAGAGQAAGISADQILGMAAALVSAGIRAEAGGTAMSQFITKISIAVSKGGEELDQFAAVAGQTAEQFKQSFQEDAAGAVLNFVTRLSELQEAGADVTGILVDMDLDAARLIDTIRRSASSSDDFAAALDRARGAMQNTTAINEEATRRYETLESKIQLTWNSINKLAITIGDTVAPVAEKLLDTIKPTIDAVTEFAEANPNLTATLVAVTGALGGVTLAAGGTLIVLGQLAFAVSSLAPIAAALTGTFGLATAAIVGIGTAALTAVGAVAALWATFKTVTVFQDYLKATKEAEEATENLKEATENLALFLAGKGVENAFRKPSESVEEWNKRVKELARQNLPGLADAMDKVATSTKKVGSETDVTTDKLDNLGTTLERFDLAETLARIDEGARRLAAQQQVHEWFDSLEKEAAEAANAAPELVGALELLVSQNEETTRTLIDLGVAFKTTIPNMSEAEQAARNLGDAYDLLGIESDALREERLNRLRAAVIEVGLAMTEGRASAEDLERAEEALAKASGDAAKETDIWGKALTQVSTIITDLGKDIVDAFIGAGSVKEAFVDALDAMLKAVLRLVAENALRLLLKLVTDLIGKIPGLRDFGSTLNDIFGGLNAFPGLPGAANAPGLGGRGPGLPGSATGIGATFGGPIGAAIGAGIDLGIAALGLIQGGRRENTLNAIEENTRFASIGIIGPRGLVDTLNIFLPYLEQINHVLWGPHLDFWAGNNQLLGDILNQLQQGIAIGPGGGPLPVEVEGDAGAPTGPTAIPGTENVGRIPPGHTVRVGPNGELEIVSTAPPGPPRNERGQILTPFGPMTAPDFPSGPGAGGTLGPFPGGRLSTGGAAALGAQFPSQLFQTAGEFEDSLGTGFTDALNGAQPLDVALPESWNPMPGDIATLPTIASNQSVTNSLLTGIDTKLGTPHTVNISVTIQGNASADDGDAIAKKVGTALSQLLELQPA